VPRSSIIISDEPLSKETNYRTEFVAVLNNQPQGGFITRKPTPPTEMIVAGDDGWGGNGWGNNSWGNNGFGMFFQRPAASQPGYPPPQAGNPRVRGGQYYYPGPRSW
jgi:hypothetical protein